MANFYNAETREPLKAVYISSSGNANIVLTGVPGSLSMRKPYLVVDNGQGKAEPDLLLNAPTGDSRWKLTGLTPGAHIVAYDGGDKNVGQIQVRRLDEVRSYGPIITRLNSRGMTIDLDSLIDYVCYASDDTEEGISFHPKSATELKTAITDTQLFHHDDRADFFGRKAASSTIGEGYREVSTPSLHVAIADYISSVHIDSYAFLFHAPDGDIIIDADAGQHIVDELWFRLPMTWLRRKNMTFLASVLQALHPVLPNSVNGYVPRLGIRVDIGGTPGGNVRSGVPLLSFEATVDFTLNAAQRMRAAASLRLLTGGKPDQTPDWVLSVKAQSECSDFECSDRRDSVGLFFNTGGR